MNPDIVQYYSVPGDDFTQAGEASSQVKRSLKQLGFPAELIRRVAIALYEGEINMAIHAGGGNIRVDISTELIHLLLSDEGPGIEDIELAMTEGYSTAPERARDLGFGAGMGLSNMRKYSDEFSIDSEPGRGTVVNITVYNK